MTQEEKAKRYDETLEIAKKNYVTAQDLSEGSQIGVECFKNTLESISPELKESEQNILFEELKALHLKMEYQTVCNDAGCNRMWRRAWQHVNEAINIIKEDKEAFKW